MFNRIKGKFNYRRSSVSASSVAGLVFLTALLFSILGYTLNILKFITIDFDAAASNEVFIRLIGIVSPLGIPLGFM